MWSILGILRWLPFSGTVANVGLVVAAGAYAGGLIWSAQRRLVYSLGGLGALVCVLLGHGWADRLSALFLLGTNVLLLLLRVPAVDSASASDSPGG